MYRSWKETRSRMTKESKGERLMLRAMGSWNSVYRSGMDSVVRGHWMSYLQTVTLKELKSWCYIYSIGIVLSTELSQNSGQGVGHQRTYFQYW